MVHQTPQPLTDFERKLLIIMQHTEREQRTPTMRELVAWTGKSPTTIRNVTKDLVRRQWLRLQDGRIFVTQKRF